MPVVGYLSQSPRVLRYMLCAWAVAAYILSSLIRNTGLTTQLFLFLLQTIYDSLSLVLTPVTVMRAGDVHAGPHGRVRVPGHPRVRRPQVRQRRQGGPHRW